MSTRLSEALKEAGEYQAWDWSRIAQQVDYLSATEAFLMFSGGFSCGKTTVLCAKVIWLLLIPNNLGYLGRMDGKALRASTLQTLYELLPDSWIASKNDQQGFLRLKPQYGGSKLIYGDLKDVGDLKNLPLGFFAIDQAEEIPVNEKGDPEVWLYLSGRLRRKIPILQDGLRQYWVLGACRGRDGDRHYALAGDAGCRLCGDTLPPFSERKAPGVAHRPWDVICYPNYGFGVCNPEGPSHWIYRYFPGLPGPNGTVSGPGVPEYRSFHATIYDANDAGFAPDEYVTRLERVYQAVPVMRDRYLSGLWVEAEGLVYPGFKRTVHVLSRFARRADGTDLLAASLPLYEYIDPGLTAPTAVGWVVVEACTCGCGKENYYLVDEYYAVGSASQVSAAIKTKRQALPYTLQVTYMDSQALSKTMMGQTGTPKENDLYSIADLYGENGVYVIANQKNWDVGYQTITDLLAIDETHVHPVTGQLGAPHFFAFSHCDNFSMEAETYKWKKARNQLTYSEEPQEGRDHHMDGLNGFVASRPPAGMAMQTTQERKETPWWEIIDRPSNELSHMAL